LFEIATGGGMQKALIVFVAVASVLLIAAFMYFIRPQTL
jgi:hypothetical protein